MDQLLIQIVVPGHVRYARTDQIVQIACHSVNAQNTWNRLDGPAESMLPIRIMALCANLHEHHQVQSNDRRVKQCNARLDCAALLQSAHSSPAGIPAQANPVPKSFKRNACVRLQLAQDSHVDVIKCLHISNNGGSLSQGKGRHGVKLGKINPRHSIG